MQFVRRQMAGAFALRALDFVAVDGRLCLILRVALLLGPSSSRFVSAFLSRCRPSRLINFGDLQGLLFPTAENTCHVFLELYQRGDDTLGRIPFQETVQYCVPKADMSLAVGTTHNAIRRPSQTTDRLSSGLAPSFSYP